MVYGAECWAVRKKEERKLHTTEMRVGKRKYETIPCQKRRHLERGMHPMAEFLREKRLRWYGHVQRREEADAT